MNYILFEMTFLKFSVALYCHSQLFKLSGECMLMWEQWAISVTQSLQWGSVVVVSVTAVHHAYLVRNTEKKVEPK